jgi:hypothetical protein
LSALVHQSLVVDACLNGPRGARNTNDVTVSAALSRLDRDP